jgi:O-antigen ligase
MSKQTTLAARLIYVYFFALLLFKGVPDLGSILLALGGALLMLQAKFRQRVLDSIGGWSAQDSWLALSIGSVFLFKLLSMLWSTNPELALKNAIWHAYLITWPLVFFSICYAKPSLINILKALAYGMIAIALWNTVALWLQQPFYHLRPNFDLNAGILAELLLVSGTWLLVAATDTSAKLSRQDKFLFTASSVCACFTLYTSGRRTEWVAFFIITLAILLWRMKKQLTIKRSLIVAGIILSVLITFFYLRQDRFLLAYHEAMAYNQHQNKDVFNQSMTTSVGARLEMYRLGISAFLDHPILGISASARPNTLPEYGGGGLGGPLFQHRHFHSEYLQALVEGGIVWAIIFACSIWFFIKKMVIETYENKNLVSMLAFALVACFMLAGSVSASLIYTQAVAVFVVFSAILWAANRVNDVDQ